MDIGLDSPRFLLTRDHNFDVTRQSSKIVPNFFEQRF